MKICVMLRGSGVHTSNFSRCLDCPAWLYSCQHSKQSTPLLNKQFIDFTIHQNNNNAEGYSFEYNNILKVFFTSYHEWWHQQVSLLIKTVQRTADLHHSYLKWITHTRKGTVSRMIMSMGWDYVSELRPPTVHPQVKYEHGEPWWNDIDRGKLIHPPELSLAILPAEPPSSKSGETCWRRWWI
jgi:hypothetical protein